MPTTILRCPTCSAPLELANADTDQASCPYCGGAVLINERTAARQAPPRAERPVTQPHRAPRTPVWVWLLALMAAAPMVLWGLIAYVMSGVPVKTPARGVFTPPPTPTMSARPDDGIDVLMAFGSRGMGPGRFEDARAIATDGAGRIYVAEYSGGRVQAFDSAGTFLTQWIVDPDMPLPTLGADRGGTVYVSYRGRIRRYEGATGRRLDDFPTPRGVRPDELALGPDGSIYAIDGIFDVVQLGRDGEVRRRLDMRELVGPRILPARIAVAGDGTLFVLDRLTGEILRIGASGRFEDRFGAGGGLGSGHDLAVDGRGRVLRAESDGVRVFDRDGNSLGVLGKGVIFGVAVTARDEVLATQRNEYRVVKLRGFGDPVRK